MALWAGLADRYGWILLDAAAVRVPGAPDERAEAADAALELPPALGIGLVEHLRLGAFGTVHVADVAALRVVGAADELAVAAELDLQLAGLPTFLGQSGQSSSSSSSYRSNECSAFSSARSNGPLNSWSIWTLPRSPSAMSSSSFSMYAVKLTSTTSGKCSIKDFSMAQPYFSLMQPAMKRSLLNAKKKILKKMAPHISHTGVHDHGFNNVSTYGNLLRLMNEGKIPFNEWEKNFYELALKISGAVQASRWTPIKERRIYSFIQWATFPICGYYPFCQGFDSQSYAWSCSSG